jgi:hypothetical protein
VAIGSQSKHHVVNEADDRREHCPQDVLRRLPKALLKKGHLLSSHKNLSKSFVWLWQASETTVGSSQRMPSATVLAWRQISRAAFDALDSVLVVSVLVVRSSWYSYAEREYDPMGWGHDRALLDPLPQSAWAQTALREIVSRRRPRRSRALPPSRSTTTRRAPVVGRRDVQLQRGSGYRQGVDFRGNPLPFSVDDPRQVHAEIRRHLHTPRREAEPPARAETPAFAPRRGERRAVP